MDPFEPIDPASKADRSEIRPRLGFQQIVPGHNGEVEFEPRAEVPIFDLNQQMMAGPRQQAATRRKGPGQRVAPPAPIREMIPVLRTGPIRPWLEIEQDPVIADIVHRDIQRLCQGAHVFV